MLEQHVACQDLIVIHVWQSTLPKQILLMLLILMQFHITLIHFKAKDKRFYDKRFIVVIIKYTLVQNHHLFLRCLIESV